MVKQGLLMVLAVAGRIFPSDGVRILTYHSVDRSGSPISVSPERFEAQMTCLADEGYRVVSLREMLAEWSEGQGPVPGDRRVVLTFDDGYRNNYTAAFPILRRMGFTATVFLAVGYIGGDNGWERDPRIRGMRLLSWEEIREMAQGGMEFGAHTVGHVDLAAVSETEAEREIRESRERIEEGLWKSADLFCYPYGRFTPGIQEQVRRAGFSGACSIRYGIGNRPEDRYALRRVGTSRFHSMQDFRAGIRGTYGWYVSLRDYVRFPGMVNQSPR